MTSSSTTAFRNIAQSHFKQNEARYFSALRIITAFIIGYRLLGISESLEYLNKPNATLVFFTNLGLLILFGTGFLSRTISLLLFISLKSFDMYYHSSTLGTDVALILFLLFFFYKKPHEHFSIGNKFNPEKRFFSFWEKINLSHRKVSLWALILYGFLSTYAVFYHVNDVYWRDGVTVKVLLMNSFLSKHYEFFRNVESLYPQFLNYFSQISVIGQTIMQFFFIPLIFFKWGRVIILVWGMVFFLFSKFFLQLSYLPDLEIVLWAFIFYPYKFGELKIEKFKVVEVLFITLLILSFVSNYFTNFKILNSLRSRFTLYAPNVFNSHDLTMSDFYNVFYCLDKDREIIPFTATDGSRLSLHKSDTLYFGNSLRWRRGKINVDLDEYLAQKGKGRKLIEQFVKFYSKKYGCKKYEVEIYKNQQSLPIYDESKYKSEIVKVLKYENGHGFI